MNQITFIPLIEPATKKDEESEITECHPSPLITKRKNNIVIYCKEDNESFVPATAKQEIRLDYSGAKTALI